MENQPFLDDHPFKSRDFAAILVTANPAMLVSQLTKARRCHAHVFPWSGLGLQVCIAWFGVTLCLSAVSWRLSR